MEDDTWVNPRDGSVMKLIPAGEFVMGSTHEDIEGATRMDKDGEQFALRHETPQFTGWMPSFYIGIYAVTNEQFARFLSEAQPAQVQLGYWLPWNERILLPVSGNKSY